MTREFKEVVPMTAREFANKLALDNRLRQGSPVESIAIRDVQIREAALREAVEICKEQAVESHRIHGLTGSCVACECANSILALIPQQQESK